MKTVLRHFAAAGLALAFSLPAYSQVIGPAPGSGNGGSLTVPSTITGSIAGSSNHGAIGYGTLGYSDTNNFGAFQTSVNSYAQFVLQNTNAGATASADYVVSNDVGTASTFYGNFGMNSSGFVGTGALNEASAVYLTSTSGDLSIGTTTSNAIHFVINSGATDALAISSTGHTTATDLALGGATLGSNALAVTGISQFAGLKVQTRVVSASTDTATTADYFLCISYTSTGAVTETLPAGATGLTLLIKDCGGSAATHNITITPAAGNIDGAGTYVMATNYGSVAVTYVNGQWSIN